MWFFRKIKTFFSKTFSSIGLFFGKIYGSVIDDAKEIGANEEKEKFSFVKRSDTANNNETTEFYSKEGENSENSKEVEESEQKGVNNDFNEQKISKPRIIIPGYTEQIDFKVEENIKDHFKEQPDKIINVDNKIRIEITNNSLELFDSNGDIYFEQKYENTSNIQEKLEEIIKESEEKGIDVSTIDGLRNFCEELINKLD